MRLGEYEFYTNDVKQVAEIMKKHGTKQDLEYYPYDEDEGFVPYYEKETIEPMVNDATVESDDAEIQEVITNEPVVESL